MAGQIQVRHLDDSVAARWDRFVERCPEATFFHLSGWRKVVEESFGHRCPSLYAEADGEIRGVLPLVHLDSRVFGSALVSNAFCVYGGPATSDDAARQALDAAAIELAERLRVEHLEYRPLRPSDRGWPANADLYCTFRKAIAANDEENLKAIPRKQRAMVRKGIKNGLTGVEDETVERFFRIYATSVRDLGTPVLPRGYFANLKRAFGENCRILTIESEGQAIASVMSFYFRDEVSPYYGGGLPAARRLAAYDFMYWSVMQRACAEGRRLFDFGRSKRGTGSFSFKKNWGFEPEPLHYEYKLLRRQEIPQVNPLNPKYRLAIAAWKRLPLTVANLLGPQIARNLG